MDVCLTFMPNANDGAEFCSPRRPFPIYVNLCNFRLSHSNASSSRNFKKKVHDNSGGRPFRSFRDGLPAEWEEYKEDVRNEALGRLRIQKWKRTDVGRGRILDNVIRAIEINDPSRVLRNNLVDWQNRFGHKALSHRALLEAESEASQRRLFEQWWTLPW